MKNNENIKPGDVVQLIPEFENQMLAGCMVTVTEVKSFGCQGYVQCTGENGKMGGQAYIRPRWDEMEYVGQAPFIIGDNDES